MSALAEFHFLRPLALLLLLALPLFWFAWRHSRADAGSWRVAVDAHLLPHLMERVGGGPGRAGVALATVLWTVGCLALAGPAWEREPMPLYRNQAARVIALDLAPTMLAQDEKPSRLERARFKVDDILARSRDYQTALIGYAGDAFVAAPLTDDVGTVRNLVGALDPSTMPVPGNAASRAITAGVNLIEQAGLHAGEVILLADSVDAAAVGAARRAHAKGVTVSVLGIGETAGAPVPLSQGDFLKDDNGNVVVARLDEAGLRAVAEAGGGHYAHLSAGSQDVDSLLADRTDTSVGADAVSGQYAESARWRDRGPWLLLLLAPLALLGFRRGWLLVVALMVAVPAQRANAMSLADLWQRPDQQAAEALAKGDAKQAASVARSPAWRGSASYRAGDYESAAADYEQAPGADGAYNRGNALAKQGHYEDALAAYDEALKLEPDMADAKANRQAVEAFLKQKQQQQKQSQKGGKKGDQKNSQQQSGQDSQKQDGQDQQSGQNSQNDQNSDQQGQQGQQQDQQSQSGDQQGGDRNDTQQKDGENQSADNSAQGSGKEEQQNASGSPDQNADAKQQQALSKAIDKALANGTPKDGEQQAGGVAEEDDATREKRQALEHWLQRVPDDPGGLLRRKFQLEYQRRQHRGGDGQ